MTAQKRKLSTAQSRLKVVPASVRTLARCHWGRVRTLVSEMGYCDWSIGVPPIQRQASKASQAVVGCGHGGEKGLNGPLKAFNEGCELVIFPGRRIGKTARQIGPGGAIDRGPVHWPLEVPKMAQKA